MKSDSIKELATALSKAQGRIKGALKDSENPFYKSKYADLASVVEAIREPLSLNGLSYVQISHEKEGASIETMIMHSSGEWLCCGAMTIPVSKADAQGFGSAMTYARRYSLSAAFGVAPEEDDGNAAAKASLPEKKIVDKAIAREKLPPETNAAISKEQIAIEKLFYQSSAKDAHMRWKETAESMSLEERAALWLQLDSKIRSGIKKYEEEAKTLT